MEEYNYTATHPLGHTEPVTGKLYLLHINIILRVKVQGVILDILRMFYLTTPVLQFIGASGRAVKGVRLRSLAC